MSYSGGVDYDFEGRITLDNSANKVIFDIGLSFGYQHYFGESENHGIKSSFFIGAGTPYNSKKEKAIFFTPPSDNPVENSAKDEVSLKTQTIPLKTRIELDYLWDFFNRGNHTIGLDVGLGYEMGAWFGKSTGSATMKDGVDSDIKIEPTKKDTTLLTHAIYPKIGIHYYYGNHQFNVAYKFGGILSGIKTEYKGEFDLKIPLAQTIQSSPSYFSFGYSYRF